ncbi:MAG TPA: MlaE family lipid ABC transporter permease subunit [Candidatus Binatia bacterium]|nr:MlaE family lipid ABC transporter permease subunit [Candidatus Binatia bacterium]
MNGAERTSAQTQYKAARISFTPDGTLHCEGAWRLDYLAELERQIDLLPETFAGPINCDARAIDTMDTGGAWLLRRTLNELQRRGCSVSLNGLSPEFATLMQTVARGWLQIERLQPSPHYGWLARMGQFACASGVNLLKALSFVGETASAFCSLLTRANQIRWRVLLYNLHVDGLNALPIIGLLSFLMGIVIAYQGSEQLKTFGANIFIVDLVGISLLREIAPLLTAILVAGRSGSAYTAQIGTMAVTEELDALRSLGISPISLLVLPRALALVIALPLLTVFANIVGVFGGMLIALSQLGVTFTEFLNRFEYAIVLRHYLVGIGKTPVFAAIIALVGCYQGFQVFGGVDSVGRRTTLSVVQAIFLVIVTDAFFSILFSWWRV